MASCRYAVFWKAGEVFKKKKQRRGNPLISIGCSGNRLIWLADLGPPTKEKKKKILNRTPKFPLSEWTMELHWARACSASFASVRVFPSWRILQFCVCFVLLLSARSQSILWERERRGDTGRCASLAQFSIAPVGVGKSSEKRLLWFTK